MKPGLARLLYGLVALGLLIYLYGYFNSDRRKIDRQLENLRQTVEKSGAESDLAAAAEARQLGFLFSRRFEIQLTPLNQTVTDRQQMMRVMLQYRRTAQRIDVGFHEKDLVIHQGPGPKSAELALVSTVNSHLDTGPARQSFRWRLEWVVEEGEWLIERAELVEILEGNPRLF